MRTRQLIGRFGAGWAPFKEVFVQQCTTHLKQMSGVQLLHTHLLIEQSKDLASCSHIEFIAFPILGLHLLRESSLACLDESFSGNFGSLDLSSFKRLLGSFLHLFVASKRTSVFVAISRIRRYVSPLFIHAALPWNSHTSPIFPYCPYI